MRISQLDPTMRPTLETGGAPLAHYFIATYDVTNEDIYRAYIREVGATVAKYGGVPLVSARQPELLEGLANRTHVVIQFPSESSARAWYADPDYQPLLALRLAATANGSAVFADSLTR